MVDGSQSGFFAVPALFIWKGLRICVFGFWRKSTQPGYWFCRRFRWFDWLSLEEFLPAPRNPEPRGCGSRTLLRLSEVPRFPKIYIKKDLKISPTLSRFSDCPWIVRRAPSLPNATAAACPIPAEDPVMITTLSSNLFDIFGKVVWTNITSEKKLEQLFWFVFCTKLFSQLQHKCFPFYFASTNNLFKPIKSEPRGRETGLFLSFKEVCLQLVCFFH